MKIRPKIALWITGAGVLVSLVFSIIVFLAMGVNDAMILNSVGLYSGHISGIALPSSIKPERLQVNGTTSVLKRILLPGAFVHQNRIQSANLIGVNPNAEKKNTAIWKKAIDGKYPRNNESAKNRDAP